MRASDAPVTRRDSGLGPLRIRRARLRFTSGERIGQAVDIPEGGLALGSDGSCEVPIPDPTVSRLHAEIRRSGVGYLLRDLGSTNGTFVGRHRVESVHLDAGTAFRLGRTTVVFESAERDLDVEVKPVELFEGLVGAAPAMRALYGAIERVANTDLSVVVEGETGTGKELVARAIHRRSRRGGGPFVALNCGALAPTLVEDELFGHEPGAFTGAGRAHAGAFEQAHGGTLLFDEIGDMPADLQPKLLRVIETFDVRRLGAARERRVDVRVIAATHHDLAFDVERGAFRSDLFFRLTEVRLKLPPLRERLDDLPRLAAHFAEGSGKRLDPAALESLAVRHWPGNVRELANVVHRALALAKGEVIAPADLPAADLATGAPSATALAVKVDLTRPIVEARENALDEFHRLYLGELLRRHGGDLHAAARAAGVHVNSLHRLLRNAGLRDR